MGYSVFPVPGFGGGLNLRDQPTDVDPQQAIDALNVYFSERGAVFQRPGYKRLTSSALTNRADSLSPFYTTSGTRQLLAGCGTRLEAVSTAGAVVASATGLTNTPPWSFARYGQPNAERAYAGNGQDTLRKWDGTTWSAPTATVDGTGGRAMPKAGLVAVNPESNRLVATGFETTTGGPNGTTSSPSHVYFSNAGDPETWETDGSGSRGANYVQLSPGDGEAITALVAWRELVFVFKKSRFFIFYGTSTDATGKPVFNFRPVDTGVGCVGPKAVAVGRDGVYFLHRNGLYRTSGGDPELLSDLIDPLFSTQLKPSAFYRDAAANLSSLDQAAVAWHEEKVYVGFPAGSTQTTNNRSLVFDPRYGWWTLTDIPAAAFASFEATAGTPELHFAYGSGTNHVAKHAKSLLADDIASDGSGGTAISSRWQSGWLDLGTTVQKTIREWKAWGSGQCEALLFYDYKQAAVPSTLTFAATSTDLFESGTNAADVFAGGSDSTDLFSAGEQPVNPALVRRAVKGTVFSLQLRNSTLNQTFSTHRLSYHVREQRIPTVLKVR